MSDPMSERELAVLKRAYASHNDVQSLLAEIDRQRASRELMLEALVNLEALVPKPEKHGSTAYRCHLCSGPWRGGGLDHKPYCLIARLRTVGEG